MSFQTSNEPRSGNIDDSADDPMTWDLSSDQGRAVMALTITASADCTLYIQEAATAEELESPLGGLPHKFPIAVEADVSQRVVEGRDPSLPFGKAWVEGEDGGTYSLSGGRRAGS